MKKFLAVYTGSPTSPNSKKWEAMDPETRKQQEKAGMTRWMDWAMKNEKWIVGKGGPLGKTKQINASGISDIRNNLAAYTIVEAETQEAAAELFKNHPHFMIFPGDSVEVMECLPVPQMK